jgi:hypothetical protein
MRRYVVTLTRDERDALFAFVSKGRHSSQEVLNALILLGCDEGECQTNHSTNEDLSRVLNISMRKIDRVKRRFITEGFAEALTRKKPGRAYSRKIDDGFEAKVIALYCSEPPGGYSRWSLRLLADRVVELGYIDAISHESIRRILNKRTRVWKGPGAGNTSGVER